MRYRADALYLGATWSANGGTPEQAKDAVIAQIVRVKGFAPSQPLSVTVRDTHKEIEEQICCLICLATPTTRDEKCSGDCL